jgi:hypothetical protein
MIYGLEITRLMIAKQSTESRSPFGAGGLLAAEISPLCTQHRMQQILKLLYVQAITCQTMRLVLQIRDLPRPIPGSRPPSHVIIDRN